MFTTSSISATPMIDKLLNQVRIDNSAYPIWFITPSGMDLYSWQVVEYPENKIELAENALKLPNEYRVFKPLPKDVGLFTPKTELAGRLWEIRKRIVASGEPLLDWNGVQKEIAQRRTERG